MSGSWRPLEQPIVDTAGWRYPDGYRLDNHAMCRSCGASIAWMVHQTTGRKHPFSPDATSHFATCPQADYWRGRKRGSHG